MACNRVADAQRNGVRKNENRSRGSARGDIPPVTRPAGKEGAQAPAACAFSVLPAGIAEPLDRASSSRRALA